MIYPSTQSQHNYDYSYITLINTLYYNFYQILLDHRSRRQGRNFHLSGHRLMCGVSAFKNADILPAGRGPGNSYGSGGASGKLDPGANQRGPGNTG